MQRIPFPNGNYYHFFPDDTGLLLDLAASSIITEDNAGVVDFTESGHPKVDTGYPVMSLSMAYDGTDRVPLFQDISDMSQFQHMVGKGDHPFGSHLRPCRLLVGEDKSVPKETWYPSSTSLVSSLPKGFGIGDCFEGVRSSSCQGLRHYGLWLNPLIFSLNSRRTMPEMVLLLRLT
jgi:hypothetical protein